jgi:hypothetical protein
MTNTDVQSEDEKLSLVPRVNGSLIASWRVFLKWMLRAQSRIENTFIDADCIMNTLLYSATFRFLLQSVSAVKSELKYLIFCEKYLNF